MTVDSTSITELAAYARSLFKRAKTSGPDFEDVAAVVRPLHTHIKHLRAEAEDPDSLLNSAQQNSSVYARQLAPIVEDTDFTLKQLDTILTKYGSSPGDDGIEDSAYRADHGERRLEDREREMLQLIRTKLSNQKTHIDIFLDTVQLHNPARQPRPVDLDQTDSQQQNAIKDKVDVVAARIFRRRAVAKKTADAVDDNNEEEMWQQFWAELVKEGFSSDVLRKHKEVLRAYIRELEANGSVDENPPSVRGLLDHASGGSAYVPQQQCWSYPDAPAAPAYGSHQQYGPSTLPPPVAIPRHASSRGDTMSTKELVSPTLDNEKFAPGVKLGRPQPECDPHYNRNGDHTHAAAQYNSEAPLPPGMTVQLPWDRPSSDSASDTELASTQQLALISTRDLMDCDQRRAETLAVPVGGLHPSPALHPASGHGASPGSSPAARYLPPPLTYQGKSSLSPELGPATQPLGTSPRYLPPLADPASAYGASPASPSMTTPPPRYSVEDPAATVPFSATPTTYGSPAPPPADGPTPQRRCRLGPDSTGAEISLDATWTRIKRTLVSPEALDRAGLRYEARPDFVAVLGVLSKEDIASLARKSAEIRSSRARGDSNSRPARPVPNASYPDKKRAEGSGKKSSRHSDTTDDESISSDTIWDESDSSSDSESDDQHSRTRERRSSASNTDKYIPRDVRRRRRERRDSVIQEEPVLEDVYDSTDGSHKNERNRRLYPVIVPPPLEKGSPASTVAPKPILKNRNENHVRFDEDGPREMSPGELNRERDRERRDRRERRRAAERDSDRRRDRGDRDRRERDRGEREREKERDRERHRDRDRDGREHHHPSSHSTRHRDRDDSGRSERRRAKKSVWGETLGAVGVGGAAATLLGVLTEAASGF